jgi:acetyltransferase-like isoleucine patch superfamily enzyme
MKVRTAVSLGKLYLERLKTDARNMAKVISVRTANPGARVGTDVRILGNPRQLNLGEECEIEDGALLDFRDGGSLDLGSGVTVKSGAILAPFGGFIRIGEKSGVNHYSVLYGHGGLTIGRYVRFAAHCLVVPANHGIAKGDIPIFVQPLSTEGISIDDDVWIGAHCVILDGVSIGRGAVIAAGSIVNRSVPPQTVAAGVPAKAVHIRQDEHRPVHHA